MNNQEVKATPLISSNDNLFLENLTKTIISPEGVKTTISKEGVNSIKNEVNFGIKKEIKQELGIKKEMKQEVCTKQEIKEESNVNFVADCEFSNGMNHTAMAAAGPVGPERRRQPGRDYWCGDHGLQAAEVSNL